ncbi:MAG: hypothetical protein AAFQ84_08465, partial [Pseudomonadota bacterium]
IAEALGPLTCQTDEILTLDAPAFIVGSKEGERYEFPAATLRITGWGPEPSASNDPDVVFYETLWTPYADAFTEQFVAPDLARRDEVVLKPPFCGDRPKRRASKKRYNARPIGETQPRLAAINRSLKEGVMIGGVTDAIIAIGPLGIAARDAIRQSLCIMTADALDVEASDAERTRCFLRGETLERYQDADGIKSKLSNDRFAYLTYSLGSFLFLDMLDEFRLWPDDLGDPSYTCALMPALLNDAPVYMFSNQVNLFLAAHPHFGCDPDGKCELYTTYDDRASLLFDPRARDRHASVDRACKDSACLQIIAFNDPNDVMGYRLPPILRESTLINQVINVRVRNPAFWVPGVFVSPAGAHNNHGKNRAILRLMIEGAPAGLK